MPPPSIRHQQDHIAELCCYYQTNIVYVSDAHKKEIEQLCKAVNDTFSWFANNERRIKTALSATNSGTQTDQRPDKDHVKHAATLCADPSFQTFLKWYWDDKGWSYSPKGTEAEIAAHRVRSLCSVKSRAQFNKHARDGRAWEQLFRKYKNWEQHGV